MPVIVGKSGRPTASDVQSHISDLCRGHYCPLMAHWNPNITGNTICCLRTCCGALGWALFYLEIGAHELAVFFVELFCPCQLGVLTPLSWGFSHGQGWRPLYLFCYSTN